MIVQLRRVGCALMIIVGGFCLPLRMRGRYTKHPQERQASRIHHDPACDQSLSVF